MNERNGPTIRQWKLLRLIHGNRYMTVPILAEKLECSIKTIRRDCMSLEAAGFPLWFERSDDDNYVRLEHDWFIRLPQAGAPIRHLERRRVP